jgi:hypothetical protein
MEPSARTRGLPDRSSHTNPTARESCPKMNPKVGTIPQKSHKHRETLPDGHRSPGQVQAAKAQVHTLIWAIVGDHGKPCRRVK